MKTKSKLLVQRSPTVESPLEELAQRDNARSAHFDSSQRAWNETRRGDTAKISGRTNTIAVELTVASRLFIIE